MKSIALSWGSRSARLIFGLQVRAVAVFVLVLAGGCGGGGSADQPPADPAQGSYHADTGVAQKGPLIRGSTVTAQELDVNLSPTGKQYSFQTTTDLGKFSPTSTFTSQYIGLNAIGYYYDEVKNTISGGVITLNGYSDLSVSPVLNVNLLTTLAYQRVQKLVVTSKLTIPAATAQAEQEVLAALNIPSGNYGRFSTLDLGGGKQGDFILAAISSLFVQGNTAGTLNVLIASVQSEIGAAGVLTSAATKVALAAAAQAVNPAVVAANLSYEYSSIGVRFTAADISNWIDQDGDGVIGLFKYQVASATPASVFTLPGAVVDRLAGTLASVTAGQLFLNGVQATGAVAVKTGDVVALSPGPGSFPNGVLSAYLLGGGMKVARVSFVSQLQSIAVTPASLSVPLGLAQQFKAVGSFSDTSTADLSNKVAWTSSEPGRVQIDPATGLASAKGLGASVISASLGGVTGTATASVTGVALQSIALTPASMSTGVGIWRRLVATGTYSDGSTRDVTAGAKWDMDDPNVAMVTAGTVTGRVLGSTTVRATSGAVSSSAVVAVTTGVWSPGASMQRNLSGFTATLLSSGKVMTTGGDSLSGDAEIYNPDTDTWTQAGIVTRVGHTATLLANGKLLVAGGGDHRQYLSNCTLYDPTLNTWSTAGNLNWLRSGHTATLLTSGKVLAVGGVASGVQPRPELYDPATNSWTLAAAMLVPRFDHTATQLTNGKVLVIGGIGQVGIVSSGVAQKSVEIYDPGTDTWTSLSPMTTPRQSHTATLLDNGKVLVTGGEATPGNPFQALSSAELYDPATDRWSAAGSMATVRTAHSAVLLRSGRVLAFGGRSTLFIGLASAEIFDPATNAWTSAQDMPYARPLPIAVGLQNGAYLVCGDPRAGGGTTGCDWYW